MSASPSKRLFVDVSLFDTDVIKVLLRDLDAKLFNLQDYGNAPYGPSSSVNREIDRFHELLRARELVINELRAREASKRRRSPTVSANKLASPSSSRSTKRTKAPRSSASPK
jgi:hypothetical protein